MFRRWLWLMFCIASTAVLLVAVVAWAVQPRALRANGWLLPEWVSRDRDWAMVVANAERLELALCASPKLNRVRVRSRSGKEETKLDYRSVMMVVGYFLDTPGAKPIQSLGSFAGADWSYRRVQSGKFPVTEVKIGLPWWMIALAAAPGTAGLIVDLRRRKHRRANPSQCKRCGYDLRAGHDRCPECGAASHVKVAEESDDGAIESEQEKEKTHR